MFVILAMAGYLLSRHDGGDPLGIVAAVEWQRMANPGELSQAHAFLGHNCEACHTPTKGAEAINCITCHANSTAILQRQPTAFHANIGSCRECHTEHQGRASQITEMNHDGLATIGIQQLSQGTDLDDLTAATAEQLSHWLKQKKSDYPTFSVNSSLSLHELTLNCATCHQNDDRHFSYFGTDCSACHGVSSWDLPEFQHPGANSMDCAQCHQAPPSHYMKHFNMISAKVAGEPHVRVDQCFVCHQDTSWNDIRRVGWYKHH